MTEFNFHPELFEQRAMAIKALSEHGFNWLEHFSSVDLLHDLFGLEVCGIAQKPLAASILRVLERVFPEWIYSDLCYHDDERDRGWKAVIFQKPSRPVK